MTEEMTVKIRSRSGAPLRVDRLALALEAEGAEIVSIPTRGAHVRVVKPLAGWPPLKSRRQVVPLRALAPEMPA